MSMTRIETVRASINQLKREHAELQAQCRSRSEVRSHVENVVNEWNSEARGQNGLHLRLIASGQSPVMLETNKLGPAFVLLLGADRVAKALLAELESVTEGLNFAERAARIARVEVELDALEHQEEALIVAAEEADERVIRRYDAKPEIVLGRREPAPAVSRRSPHYQGLGDVMQKRRRFGVTPIFPGHDPL